MKQLRLLWPLLVGICVVITSTSAFAPKTFSSTRKASWRSIVLSAADESQDTADGAAILSPFESLQTKVRSTQKSFQSAADEGFGTKAKNAANTCAVGDIIVPLCSNLAQRQILANRGIYPGVEYKVIELSVGDDDDEEMKVNTVKGLPSPAQAKALIRPAYPLREHLERSDWPVSVQLDEVPLWLSRSTYIAGNALGTAALSSFFLVVAAFFSLFLRIVSVPTPSMLPSLSPGNVVLVTRSIPIGPFKPHVGDVVFFDAPKELESTVSNLNLGDGSEVASTKGRQFLKRVVAVPGEKVGVRRSEPYVEMDRGGNQDGMRYRFDIIGPYSKPELFAESSWDRPPATLSRNEQEYFVAGDNGYRSVDSRVWGPLKGKYIVGTAKLRIWPLKEFGPIPPGPIREIVKNANN